MKPYDVALLTDRRYTANTAAEGDWYLRNILDDDRLLQDALARRGLGSVRVDWADPAIDWSRFRCALFAARGTTTSGSSVPSDRRAGRRHTLPVYGRVDMVQDNDSRLALMELELIEPEL